MPSTQRITPLDRRMSKDAQAMQRGLTRSKPEAVDAARRMLFMVKAVDLTYEPLYDGPALARAVWRYEALWLPLLFATSPAHAPPVQILHSNAFARTVDEIRAKNSAAGGLNLTHQDLVPPLDIAWVWHCHRLNPHRYASDIGSLTSSGAPLDTDLHDSFRFSDGQDAQSKRVRMLWENVYPFEAFMPKYLLSHSYEVEERIKRQAITSYSNEMTRTGFRTMIRAENIMRVASIQKTFLWQVVGGNSDPVSETVIETNEYLGRAYDRYLLFLALHKRVNSDQLLVPMNDINIIWHSHLSCSHEYKVDCQMLLGYTLKHDSIGVEDRRLRRAQMVIDAVDGDDSDDPNAGDHVHDPLDFSDDNETESLGLPSVDLAEMEESEIAELLEKRRRGVSIKETKLRWEETYGSKPRYDLPDTLYRGEPEGERGGFYYIFERTNGTSKDLSWPVTFALMVLSSMVGMAGFVLASWSFYRTMVTHGKFLAGVPLGVGILGASVYAFLKIPINRPLSSDARFWLDRSLKQTHNPLPPYLISSTKRE